MIKLDQNEEKIVKELIRNPRISDNQLAKNTGIPTTTVNRKRKSLEKRNLIRYYAVLDTSEFGTNTLPIKQLYIIKFKIGISRKQFLEKVVEDKSIREFNSNFINASYLGERDGHLALIMLLKAENEVKLMNEFNEKIIPYFRGKLGESSIEEVMTSFITNPIRVHHNYMPYFNMENGLLKDEWDDNWIFINETSDFDSKEYKKKYQKVFKELNTLD